MFSHHSRRRNHLFPPTLTRKTKYQYSHHSTTPGCLCTNPSLTSLSGCRQGCSGQRGGEKKQKESKENTKEQHSCPPCAFTHSLHVASFFSLGVVRSVVASEGDSVELSCYAGGMPIPDISWRRENNAILPTGGSIYR